MTESQNVVTDLHKDQPVLTKGEALGRARAALIMLHGRGARAEDILTLAEPLALPGFAYLAPQAAGNTWYPQPYLAPLASNEPWLSFALARVGALLAQAGAAGIPPERTVLLGFSQGACLALEFSARHATRYGGVVGLSGDLIGPPDLPRSDRGSLAGTPVFLGHGGADPLIPVERAKRAAPVLRALGANVTERVYPNLDHSVNQEELDFVRGMLQSIL